MKNTLWLLGLLVTCLLLQFCTTTKSAAGKTKDAPPVVTVSYTKDVAPIMAERCTPCHFPDGGKKKFLDTHAAVKENIDDIIHRVSIPADQEGFMPFKSKKAPLSDSLVQVIKTWKESGMPE